MSTEIAVPHSREAEQALVGALIQDVRVYADIREIVGAEDVYLPAHQVIFAAAVALIDATGTVDAMAVMGELARTGMLERCGGGGYLAELITNPWQGVNVTYQARLIREHSLRRQIMREHSRMGQALSEIADFEELRTEIARRNLQLDLLVDASLEAAQVEGVMSWAELWARHHSDRPDWMVDGLLLREDVFMLLGGEGSGKSWLGRQFALALAAGVHPFHAGLRIDPIRTLLVDLENPTPLLAYESRLLGTAVSRMGELDHDRARVWAHGEGLNIRDRKDAMLLERVVAEHQPDLVVIGPLYKTFRRGSDGWDVAAEEARDVFDRIRRRHNCALMIEHHMPKPQGGQERATNPFGALTWMQWPSIGKAIKQVGDNMWSLVDFRGTRLARELPVGLHRGGDLPWAPTWDPAEVEYGMWEHLRPRDNQRGRRNP